MAILFTVEVMVYGKCGSVSGLQLPNGKLLSLVNSSSSYHVSTRQSRTRVVESSYLTNNVSSTYASNDSLSAR